MESNFLQSHTLAGTGGGLLLVLCCRISSGEAAHTAALAALGATVSFLISVILKRVKDAWQKKQQHSLTKKQKKDGKI